MKAGMDNVIDLAREHLAGLDAPRRSKSDPQDSHMVVFDAAAALVKGFSLSASDAERLLDEFCRRSDQPWSAREISYKIKQAEMASCRSPGYLLRGERNDGNKPKMRGPNFTRVFPKKEDRRSFSQEALRAAAGDRRGKVDAVWLGNRSEVDPAECDSNRFLRMMFRDGERVIIFNNQHTQGQAVWPVDGIPEVAAEGMWFLIQPVDGRYHDNPRTGNPSRRSEEAVKSWRYLLLESDEAAAGDWLGALAGLRAEIAAIYSSGGRSVHSLVKVDCASKKEWDRRRANLLGTRLVVLGLDERAVTGVRLSRLPQQPRPEKRGYQKLLYVRSFPTRDRLIDLPAVRDVEAVWMERGVSAFRARDVAAMRAALVGLEYYGRVRERMAAAARDIRAVLEKFDIKGVVR
jgi:hypothetical protein